MRNLDILDNFAAAFAEVADSPERTAPPDEGDARADFLDLPRRRQLDCIERACRVSAFYRGVMADFLLDVSEDKWKRFLGIAIDSCATETGVGDEFREILVSYFATVAGLHGDDLAEFLP